MSDGFRTPFKDHIQAKVGYQEKPTLGNAPDAPTAGHTGESGFGSVKQAGLPENSLKHGTPDSGNAHQG